MNTIIVVADALRSDHCSCYGYHRKTTPNLDRLGESGVVIEDCHAQATWTRAAGATILTGCYPNTHKTETRSDALPPDVPYLPRAFQDAGHETLGVSAMANISTVTGFGRGFDEFVDLYEDDRVTEKRSNTTASEEQVPEVTSDLIAYPRAEDAIDQVIPWLRRRPNSDCFVLVWLIDPHDPYDPPPDHEHYLNESYDGDPEMGRERGTVADATEPEDFQRLRNLYDSEIRYMDDQIGRLTDELRSLGQFDETTLVVTGDHGESFGEREWRGSPSRAHNTPPFDERLRVPLVVDPARQQTEEFVDPTGLVEHVDIAASLLSANGLSSDLVQGVPLLPDHEKSVVFSKTQQEESHAPYYSAKTADTKLIEFERPPFRPQTIFDHPLHWLEHWTQRTRWFYDLETDPDEQTPTYNGPSGSNLVDRLNDWRRQTTRDGDRFDRAASRDDKTVTDQLEALGYVE